MKPLLYTFHAFGHLNLLGTHRNTIEFTKDSELTKDGDCIIGVRATFDHVFVQKICGQYKTLRVSIQCGSLHDSFVCTSNPDFSSEKELVFRISNFVSERTAGTRATKAAGQIHRSIIHALQDYNTKIEVRIEPACKALIFDFDDTIEDFQKAKEITHQYLARYVADRYHIPEREAKKELDSIDAKYSQLGKGKTPNYFSRHPWFREFFLHFKIDASQKDIAEFVELYWKKITQSATLLPGAMELLLRLTKKHHLILMTDSDGSKGIKLRRLKNLNVYHLFDFIITSDDTGHNKPHPSFYEKIFQRFEIRAEECIMIGDKPQVDLEIAKKIGLTTFWMQHGDWTKRQGGMHFSYVDYEVSTIAELESVLTDMI